MAESLWKACGLGFGTERALLQWRFDHEPVARALQSGSSSQVPGPGKAGQAGTSHLKAGVFCPHSCPPATP